jgi:hypothetical protein
VKKAGLTSEEQSCDDTITGNSDHAENVNRGAKARISEFRRPHDVDFFAWGSGHFSPRKAIRIRQIPT